jgi:hypothetical protein
MERDPQGLVLDDAVSEGAGRRVRRVVVARVRLDVDPAVLAADGAAAEPDGAVGEALAVDGPAWVAPPAVVNRIAGAAVARRILPRSETYVSMLLLQRTGG